MFALRYRKTGRLVGVYASANDGDFCVSVQCRLSLLSNNVWVVTDHSVAKKAAKTNTEWYNASYTTPENPYVGELEVVELVVKE